MFDPILVPLDGSLVAECLLPHTVALAKAFQARVVLLRVLCQNRTTESAQSVDPLDWQIGKTEAKVYLEHIQAQLHDAELEAQIATSEGLAAQRIVGFSQAEKMNLIMVSNHGRSGLNQWSMGSVAQKIIMSAPTSLLIVRANQSAPGGLTGQHYKRILIPLDGSWRAEYVLPVISMLARFHESQIHIAHVVKKPEMARHMPLNEEDVDLSNRTVARNQEEAERYMEQLQLRLPLQGLNVQTHLLVSDNAAATLHEFVEQESIDLVALCAHGYSGHVEWPYGSLVNNFMAYGKVPLLIVQDLTADAPILADLAVRDYAGHK